MSSIEQRLCKKLHYQFKDSQLLETALTHRSASRHHNERLEFLGDGVLNFAVASLLFQRFPTANEGVLSRFRAALVKEKTLAELAKRIELGDALRLGPGEMKSGGDRRESILADSFEALIGAIYLDCGFEACAQVVSRLFEDSLNKMAEASELKDPKTRIQEHLQSKRLPLPEYTLLKVSGEAHARHFVIECSTVLTASTQGEGSSRRAAEQDAAAKALEQLND